MVKCKHCGEEKEQHEKVEVCDEKMDNWKTIYFCNTRQRFEEDLSKN